MPSTAGTWHNWKPHIAWKSMSWHSTAGKMPAALLRMNMGGGSNSPPTSMPCGGSAGTHAARDRSSGTAVSTAQRRRQTGTHNTQEGPQTYILRDEVRRGSTGLPSWEGQGQAALTKADGKSAQQLRAGPDSNSCGCRKWPIYFAKGGITRVNIY